jgi:hypothetical protein
VDYLGKSAQQLVETLWISWGKVKAMIRIAKSEKVMIY